MSVFPPGFSLPLATLACLLLSRVVSAHQVVPHGAADYC